MSSRHMLLTININFITKCTAPSSQEHHGVYANLTISDLCTVTIIEINRVNQYPALNFVENELVFFNLSVP